MRKDTGKRSVEQGLPFGGDPLTEAIRREIGTVIETILAEEMAEKLGAGPYAREEERKGYRNGTQTRRLVTSLGPTTFSKPRGRLWKDGSEQEVESQMLPRYQRRARKVDQQILAMYLSGVNTRKVSVHG